MGESKFAGFFGKPEDSTPNTHIEPISPNSASEVNKSSNNSFAGIPLNVQPSKGLQSNAEDQDIIVPKYSGVTKWGQKRIDYANAVKQNLVISKSNNEWLNDYVFTMSCEKTDGNYTKAEAIDDAIMALKELMKKRGKQINKDPKRKHLR